MGLRCYLILEAVHNCAVDPEEKISDALVSDLLQAMEKTKAALEKWTQTIQNLQIDCSSILRYTFELTSATKEWEHKSMLLLSVAQQVSLLDKKKHKKPQLSLQSEAQRADLLVLLSPEGFERHFQQIKQLSIAPSPSLVARLTDLFRGEAGWRQDVEKLLDGVGTNPKKGSDAFKFCRLRYLQRLAQRAVSIADMTQCLAQAPIGDFPQLGAPLADARQVTILSASFDYVEKISSLLEEVYGYLKTIRQMALQGSNAPSRYDVLKAIDDLKQLPVRVEGPELEGEDKQAFMLLEAAQFVEYAEAYLPLEDEHSRPVVLRDWKGTIDSKRISDLLTKINGTVAIRDYRKGKIPRPSSAMANKYSPERLDQAVVRLEARQTELATWYKEATAAAAGQRAVKSDTIRVLVERAKQLGLLQSPARIVRPDMPEELLPNPKRIPRSVEAMRKVLRPLKTAYDVVVPWEDNVQAMRTAGTMPSLQEVKALKQQYMSMLEGSALRVESSELKRLEDMVSSLKAWDDEYMKILPAIEEGRKKTTLGGIDKKELARCISQGRKHKIPEREMMVAIAAQKEAEALEIQVGGLYERLRKDGEKSLSEDELSTLAGKLWVCPVTIHHAATLVGLAWLREDERIKERERQTLKEARRRIAQARSIVSQLRLPKEGPVSTSSAALNDEIATKLENALGALETENEPSEQWVEHARGSIAPFLPRYGAESNATSPAMRCGEEKLQSILDDADNLRISVKGEAIYSDILALRLLLKKWKAEVDKHIKFLQDSPLFMGPADERVPLVPEMARTEIPSQQFPISTRAAARTLVALVVAGSYLPAEAALLERFTNYVLHVRACLPLLASFAEVARTLTISLNRAKPVFVLSRDRQGRFTPGKVTYNEEGKYVLTLVQRNQNEFSTLLGSYEVAQQFLSNAFPLTNEDLDVHGQLSLMKTASLYLPADVSAAIKRDITTLNTTGADESRRAPRAEAGASEQRPTQIIGPKTTNTVVEEVIEEEGGMMREGVSIEKCNRSPLVIARREGSVASLKAAIEKAVAEAQGEGPLAKVSGDIAEACATYIEACLYGIENNVSDVYKETLSKIRKIIVQPQVALYFLRNKKKTLAYIRLSKEDMIDEAREDFEERQRKKEAKKKATSTSQQVKPKQMPAETAQVEKEEKEKQIAEERLTSEIPTPPSSPSKLPRPRIDLGTVEIEDPEQGFVELPALDDESIPLLRERRSDLAAIEGAKSETAASKRLETELKYDPAREDIVPVEGEVDDVAWEGDVLRTAARPFSGKAYHVYGPDVTHLLARARVDSKVGIHANRKLGQDKVAEFLDHLVRQQPKSSRAISILRFTSSEQSVEVCRHFLESSSSKSRVFLADIYTDTSAYFFPFSLLPKCLWSLAGNAMMEKQRELLNVSSERPDGLGGFILVIVARKTQLKIRLLTEEEQQARKAPATVPGIERPLDTTTVGTKRIADVSEFGEKERKGPSAKRVRFAEQPAEKAVSLPEGLGTVQERPVREQRKRRRFSEEPEPFATAYGGPPQSHFAELPRDTLPAGERPPSSGAGTDKTGPAIEQESTDFHSQFAALQSLLGTGAKPTQQQPAQRFGSTAPLQERPRQEQRLPEPGFYGTREEESFGGGYGRGMPPASFPLRESSVDRRYAPHPGAAGREQAPQSMDVGSLRAQSAFPAGAFPAGAGEGGWRGPMGAGREAPFDSRYSDDRERMARMMHERERVRELEMRRSADREREMMRERERLREVMRERERERRGGPMPMPGFTGGLPLPPGPQPNPFDERSRREAGRGRGRGRGRGSGPAGPGAGPVSEDERLWRQRQLEERIRAMQSGH